MRIEFQTTFLFFQQRIFYLTLNRTFVPRVDEIEFNFYSIFEQTV